MRPYFAMVMEQKIIGSGVGAAGGLSAAALPADLAVDFLFKFYGIIAQPVSTERGVEFRAIDGETVAVMNADNSLTLEPSGERFESEDVAFALAPRHGEEPQAQNKICSVEGGLPVEENCSVEKQVCEAPVWPPAAESYAECDPKPQEKLIHKDDGRKTKNRAKMLAGESPVKNSNPVPSKDDPPKKDSVAEGEQGDELFDDQKEDLFSRSAKAETKIPEDDPLQPEADESSADVGGELLAGGAVSVEEPNQMPVSEEILVTPAAPSACSLNSFAVFAGASEVDVVAERERSGGLAADARTSAKAQNLGAAIFAGIEAKSAEVAFAALRASLVAGGRLNDVGAEAVHAKAHDVRIPGDVGSKRSVARVTSASRNAEMSGRVCVFGERSSDGAKAQSASFGGAALLGNMEDPAEIAGWTAPFGGLPHVLAALFAQGGVSKVDTRQPHLVVRADARGDSGRQQGDDDGRGGGEGRPEWFEMEDEGSIPA